jgi:1A family penicillin-binding protein
MSYDDQSTQPGYPVYQQSPTTAQKPKRGCCGCLSTALIGGVVMLTLLVFGGVLVAGTLIYTNFSREIEVGVTKLDTARERETFETTRIFDRNGELLWEFFGEGNRTQISLTQVPQHMIDATISVEDDSFYQNTGLDLPAVAAALIANYRNPDARPVGGSTITQQIVRHIVFDYDERTAVSYNRKAKEIVLAWLMDQKYSKDEILEMYLNEIYYGNLAYGVEAAAQTYFKKSAVDLTMGETSLLAGLPQSPVELDPYTNLDGAKDRQWLILNLMVGDGYISQAEAEAAYQETLNFAAQEVSLDAPHFAVYARQQLEEIFGADVVANGGLQVKTSLDINYQRLAEQLARQHVSSIDPQHNLTNAALVAMKPGTGEILAMLGSVDYHDESIDGHVNVTTSLQQPGSSIKPLTYAAALSPDENGDVTWTAADILWDVPVDYPQFDGSEYSPVNYDSRFHGPTRLRAALANSYNVPAVLTLQDVGIPQFMEFAQKMGITTWGQDSSNYGLSLTLGGAEVTPLDLTTAYATFANGGQHVDPVSILRVTKNNGEVVYEHQSNAGEQVLDPRISFLISDILDDDIARTPAMGSNNPLALPFPAAAKTGTTNDFRDNWTMGYTPGLVVGVWTGNTDNSEMINISGLTGAAPLWSDYMQAIYSDFGLLESLNINGLPPATEFVPPAGLEKRPLCAISSVTVGATDCTRSGEEWFLTDGLPQETEPVDPNIVQWEELETAVLRAPAVPLPPLPPEITQVSTGEEADKQPPPQLFCHIFEGTEVTTLPPDALPQIFLKPPRNPESLKSAHEWAQANNIAILPTTACNEELLTLARDPNTPAIWRITSPADGDVVDGVMPIMGTADFDPAQIQFYKLELGVPDGDNIKWLTLGNTHETPVVNGILETLYAEGLAPGEYLLRLIIVKDSNYVGEPHTIQFSVQ